MGRKKGPGKTPAAAAASSSGAGSSGPGRAPAPAAASTAAGGPEVGDAGELVGLRGREDLNGRRVEVEARTAGKDGAPRFVVRVLGEGGGERGKGKATNEILRACGASRERTHWRCHVAAAGLWIGEQRRMGSLHSILRAVGKNLQRYGRFEAVCRRSHWGAI